jgi:hypothetical protein
MCTNLSPCSSSLGGLQSWVKAIQSTTQSGRNRIKGSQTHHPALPQGHRDQRLQGQPSRQKSLPFSSCSGDIWAISVSSDCSSRALSLLSEHSCLSSPSTLSRAVGRA